MLLQSQENRRCKVCRNHVEGALYRIDASNERIHGNLIVAARCAVAIQKEIATGCEDRSGIDVQRYAHAGSERHSSDSENPGACAHVQHRRRTNPVQQCRYCRFQEFQGHDRCRVISGPKSRSRINDQVYAIRRNHPSFPVRDEPQVESYIERADFARPPILFLSNLLFQVPD